MSLLTSATRISAVTVFLVTLAVCAALLCLQLPFLYYSDDIVFHAAKIMAAADGDYFADPITGFKSLYPPLFHIMVAFIVRLLDLTSFQTSRIIQIIQFLGMFFSVFCLLRGCFGSREKAAVGALLLVLVTYAPTGRYWLLHNPSNFSLMFVVAGTCLLMKFTSSQRLVTGSCGAVLAAIGVNIWWWNIIPVAAVFGGILISWASAPSPGRRWGWLVVVMSVFALGLAYNLWPYLAVREVLPNYQNHWQVAGFASTHSLVEVISAWIGGFLLKGNQQFFNYLYPEAWRSPNQLVQVYGLVASIYYFLLLIPFNLFLLYVATRHYRLGTKGHDAIKFKTLWIAAIVTFLLSILTLIFSNPSITRRVQFYCFIFLLPLFIRYLYVRMKLDSHRLVGTGLVWVGALALVFNAIYRPVLCLTDPCTPATREVAEFIGSLPNHEDQRLFVTEFDNHRLLRQVRYRSFLLRGNPIYFSQDQIQADSMYEAYQAIVSRGEDAETALREFSTGYAVIGKTPFNISPVMSAATKSELAEPMLAYFRARAEAVLVNDEWEAFQLTYPFKTMAGGDSE